MSAVCPPNFVWSNNPSGKPAKRWQYIIHEYFLLNFILTKTSMLDFWHDLLSSSSDEIILTLTSKDTGIIRKGLWWI